MPPLSLWMRIEHPDRSPFRLWLPLFLVWLILLVPALIVLAVVALVDLVLLLAGARYHHYSVLLVRCAGLLAATRGLVVSVHGDDAVVDVTIA